MWLIIIIAIISIFVYVKFRQKFKKVNLGAVCLITGGVKTGKTTLSVNYVQKFHKKRVRETKVHNFFNKILCKSNNIWEMPLIYSNMPLSVPYVPLTDDLLNRKKRFVYRSVVYLNEASLIAGSMDFKCTDLNEALTLLVKLIGHELKCGDPCLFIDTQSIEDLHFGFKRNLSNFLYIHSKKSIPFFLILKVRELIFMDGTVNSFNEDMEETMKILIVPKSTWKLFDCFAYSSLTDDLPIEQKVSYDKNLKIKNIVTFKPNLKLYLQKIEREKIRKENVKNDETKV